MNVENSKEDNHKNSLLSQIRDFGVGPIIGMGISMLTVPVTTRLLAPEEYGKASLFTLFQTLFLIIGLLGQDQGYVRYYNDNKIDKTLLIQNALFFPLLLCLFLIITCVSFFSQISTLLFGSIEIGLMVAFCLFIPVMLLNRFIMLQIRMDLKGKVYSFLSIISQVNNFIILILFLFFYQKSFRSIIYAAILGMCVNTVICFIFSDKDFINKKFVYSCELQKQMFKFGLPLVPTALSTWLLNSFDKIGLRIWSSFDQLGLYSAAFKIVALLNVFRTLFTTAWTPIAYKWYEDNVPNKKFEDVSTIVLAVMVLLFSLIVVFRNVIMLFLGEEYRGTVKIFIFLLFVPVMYTVSETTCYGIYFAKKTMYSLYVVFIALLLNLLGNYLLIPKYGAEGAAITTCISYIVFFFGRTFFSRKVWFKFDLMKYFINIFFLVSLGINIMLWQNFILEVSLFVLIIIYNTLITYKVLKNYNIKDFFRF